MVTPLAYRRSTSMILNQIVKEANIVLIIKEICATETPIIAGPIIFITRQPHYHEMISAVALTCLPFGVW